MKNGKKGTKNMEPLSKAFRKCLNIRETVNIDRRKAITPIGSDSDGGLGAVCVMLGWIAPLKPYSCAFIETIERECDEGNVILCGYILLRNWASVIVSEWSRCCFSLVNAPIKCFNITSYASQRVQGSVKII